MTAPDDAYPPPVPAKEDAPELVTGPRDFETEWLRRFGDMDEGE